MELLERGDALRVLSEARQRAAEGRGCVAIVGGEAGIGKTSLVTRFVQALDADQVAWGRCDSLLTPRVLGPAYDIAARRGGRLLERMDSGAGRASVFAAFLDELRSIDATPVLVFEDLHWADEATLDLVKYLGRRIGDTRALLILTFRDDEIGERHPLRLVIGELPRESTVRIALASLSPAAVRTLAADAHDAASLHALTGGNPFFVTEVLANAGEAMPASVRDAVLARAARLSPEARFVMELVSVEPGGMEPWLVESCVAASDGPLRACEQSGVLRTTEGVIRFRHELARLAIREALGERRATVLHRQVLAALKARDSGAVSLARLAHHAEGAEDGAAVLEFARAAARRSSVLGSHREAAGHYARALRFAAALPEDERARLMEDLAYECGLTGRFDEAIALCEETIAAWRGRGDREREAIGLARQANLLIISGRNARAEEAMRSALGVVSSLPPSPAHALVYRYHAYLRMLERDVLEAISEGEKAIALAERFGDLESVIHATNTIGSSMLVNDDERGIAFLQRSLELATGRNLDYHVANAFGNLGSACGEVHRYTQARGYLEDGIAFSARHDLDNSRLYQLSWLALVHLHQGRWTEAAQAAQEVLASPISTAHGRIMAWLALGRLRARRGDPAAWTALDEALALAEGTNTLQRLAPVRAARAEAAWLEGEAGAAAREASAAYDLALRKGHAWFAGELAYWQWKGGRLTEAPPIAAKPFALQICGQWREAAQEWLSRSCPYEAARALAEGDVQAQLESLVILEGLGARPAAGRVRQALRSAGVRRIPRGPRASTRENPRGLTARELEILAGLAGNLTNAEIAARLHISAKTVEHHVGAVLAKLGTSSRRSAARAAAELGLVAK